MGKLTLANIPALGIWCSITANMFLALANISVKKSIDGQNVFALSFVQASVQCCIMMPVIIYNRVSLLGCQTERIYLIVSSLFHATFQVSFKYSLVYISASDASTISMCYSVIVTLVAPFILKEPFKKIYVFNALLTISGVIVVGKPSFLFGTAENSLPVTHSRVYGIILSVINVLLLTVVTILGRKIQQTSAWTVPTISPLLSALISFVLSFSIEGYHSPKCGPNAWLLITSSFLMALGVSGVYVAFKYEEAGPLSITGTIEIPLVILFESIVFRTLPTWTTGVGALMVVLGVFLTALESWQKGKQAIATMIYKLCCRFFRKTETSNRSVYGTYTITFPEH